MRLDYLYSRPPIHILVLGNEFPVQAKAAISPMKLSLALPPLKVHAGK